MPSESAATMLKGKAMKRATKSDEHGVSYRDSLGRRRPKTPLQDRMEHMLDSSLPMAIEFLGKFLLEARQRGHQDFPVTPTNSRMRRPARWVRHEPSGRPVPDPRPP